MEESKKVERSEPDRAMKKKHTGNVSSGHLHATDFSQNNKKKTKIAQEVTEKDPCGICLAEEGINVRGEMDCCEHYFCFACIVEWAKVESRCPTCRQRFTTICRPTRTIKVPLRDQVHIPMDEDNDAVQDPYADVFCTECNSRDDDSLLLLCDLCDSAAHTYCVGLGRTVPTGEWYCRECDTSSNLNSDMDLNDEDDDFVLECCDLDITSRSRSMARAASSTATVEKIIPLPVLQSSPFSRHAPSTPNLRRVHRRVIRRQAQRLSNAARAFASQSLASATAGQVSGPASLLTSGASRTLSGQRLLQERIQTMRENWKALQHGELQFSSQPFCFNNRMTDRANDRAHPAPSKHLKNRQGPDNQADICRAWAMMEHAKSLGAKDLGLDDRQKAERSHLVSSSAQINRNFSEARLCTSSRPIERTTVNSRVDSTSSARHNNSVLNDRISSVGFMPLPFSEHSTTSRALLTPQIGTSKSVNQAPITTICKEEHVAKLSGKLFQTSNEADATAKEKILSFVKTHMKTIHKSKQLGNYQFKEIARISTHTILAACGLQHSGQRAHYLKVTSCNHSNQQKQSPSLMPMCCKECFGSFVKDVVNRIADENLRK